MHKSMVDYQGSVQMKIHLLQTQTVYHQFLFKIGLIQEMDIFHYYQDA